MPSRADDLFLKDHFMDPASIMDMLPDQQQMTSQVPNPVENITPSLRNRSRTSRVQKDQ